MCFDPRVPPKESFKEFGKHGLKMSIGDGFVTILGPCGEPQVMSEDAAVELMTELANRLLPTNDALPTEQQIADSSVLRAIRQRP